MRDVYPSFLGMVAEWLTNVALGATQWFAVNKLKGALVVLALASSLVGAQGAGTGGTNGTPQVQTQTASSYNFTPESTISAISTTVSNSMQSLTNNSSLQNYGRLLTGFFLIAMMTWAGVKTLAASKGIGELLGEWIPILVGFGIVYLFLDRSVGSQIVSMMDGVASAIGGSNMATLEGALSTGATPIFKAIAAVVNQPRATEAAQWGSGVMEWLGTLGGSLASILIGAIAKVVACLVLVLVGVLMCAHIIMGFLSIQLVLALAPVMVPFLLFPPASWLFDSWLRFLLGACMLKVVVAFLLTMVAGLLSGMNNLAMQIYAEAGQVTGAETMYVDILLYGMMMIFAILGGLLMHQAPAIATGLLSGNAGGAGFRGISALTQSPAGRVASNGSVGLAKAAVQPIGHGASWFKGRRDGNRADAEKDLRHRSPKAQSAYNRGYRSGQKKFADDNK